MRWIIQSFGELALLDREQRVATLDAARRGARPRPCGAPTSGTRRCRESQTVICPAPYWPRRDLALEVEVLERVILGGGGEVVVPRRLGQALRERPRGEHAVVLEPQIPVQAPGVVLLDHEPAGCRSGSGLPGGRLGCGGEVTFGAVGAQAAGRPRTPCPARARAARLTPPASAATALLFWRGVWRRLFCGAALRAGLRGAGAASAVGARPRGRGRRRGSPSGRSSGRVPEPATSSGAGWTAISLPAALRSIRSRTSSR